jgi:outer membrane protein
LGALESMSRSLGAFRSAGQRTAAQQATVLSAVEDLRVQQQRYATGTSTLLDVLASQTQLDQARQALIQARYDQRIAKAELEALAGRDL